MQRHFLHSMTALCLLALAASACSVLPSFSASSPVHTDCVVSTTICPDLFVSHPLDFVTSISGETVRMFDSNGAGVAVDDLNSDGDLDIVVNNLLAPATVFENQLCTGEALEIDLLWPKSKNTRALGAHLTLHTNNGTYEREVRVVNGYASGDPARVHFGFPTGSKLMRLDIRWPDSATSSVSDLDPGTRVTVTRR